MKYVYPAMYGYAVDPRDLPGANGPIRLTLRLYGNVVILRWRNRDLHNEIVINAGEFLTAAAAFQRHRETEGAA